MCGCVFASVSAEWSPIEICGDLWGEGQINEVFYSGGGGNRAAERVSLFNLVGLLERL